MRRLAQQCKKLDDDDEEGSKEDFDLIRFNVVLKLKIPDYGLRLLIKCPR